jgi:hypothetical protein
MSPHDLTDAGIGLTLLSQVVGFARTWTHQREIKVTVNGKLSWFIRRAVQLEETLHDAGIVPPPPETPPDEPPAPTVGS